MRMLNWPFPSSPGPLFQNEGRCSAFDMAIIFQSHANKTHFHSKGCAPSLILKVRVFGTRKWPIGTIEKINLRAATQPFENSYEMRVLPLPFKLLDLVSEDHVKWRPRLEL